LFYHDIFDTSAINERLLLRGGNLFTIVDALCQSFFNKDTPFAER
jgi:hypothetical protein